MMEVPNWLRGSLDSEGVKRIEAAVIAAEKRTSAEIVPMIVHRSISTGHVPVILFLAQLLVFWTFLPLLAQWIGAPLWSVEILAVLISALVAYLQRDVDFWERLLTSRADKSASVMRRAQLEFYQSNIKATTQSTGVLIMVSELEHQAVVLADKAISDKYPPETWEKLVADLIAGIKRDDFAGGMTDAIEHAAKILEKDFPDQPGAHNQLSDKLVIKE